MKSAKRQRTAGLTDHDRFVHKSSVLLQREVKKIRTFLVRKGVQQLKQTRDALTLAENAVQLLPDNTEEKKIKRARSKVIKLQYQLQRLEQEHQLLKDLDLKAVVALALEQTEVNRVTREQHEATNRIDYEEENMGQTAEFKQQQTMEENDDGWNSEDYDHLGAESSDEEDESVKETGADELVAGPETMTSVVDEVEKQVEDATLTKDSLCDSIMQRILDHKQMQPFLDALKQHVAAVDKETAKKIRLQEKKALKKIFNSGGRETLIGGRSTSVPTSLFVGSLNSNTVNGIEDETNAAEQEIAEFLGESGTKKKKNRPGQMARRQKAMRQEEAKQRQESGGYRKRDNVVMGKYGPSERPKKKLKTNEDQRSRPTGPRRDERSQLPAWMTRGGKQPVPVDQPPKSTRGIRKPEEAPSHPSWIAKQALKEKEKTNIHAFAGKKITFD